MNKMLAYFQRVCTEKLSLDAQLSLFREINQLPLKGADLAETVRYMQGFLQERNRAPIQALNLVGTGGDGVGTFNISTTAALLLARKGIPIAKHGSVSVSSRSGSVDCLHALGISCAADFATAMRELRETGATFLFVRDFYPILANFHEARLMLKNAGEKTLINLLGPLLNPLYPRYQVTGVYAESLLEPMAEAMHKLGYEGFVVTSEGTDELTLSPDHQVLEVRDSGITTRQFDLEAMGFEYASIHELAGGSPLENAATTRGILDGSVAGPKAEVVRLNALLGELAYGA